jgi:hypothetical protein
MQNQKPSLRVKRVIAEPERAATIRCGRRQCLQAVQRVVDVARRAAFRVGETGAIGRRVIPVRRGEIPACQESIARGRVRQPPHDDSLEFKLLNLACRRKRREWNGENWGRQLSN